MKAKRFQVLGSVVGGFLSGAAFWACSEPATGTAADTCECTSEVSALESRIAVLEAQVSDAAALEERLASLEATAVQHVGGEATVPASVTDSAEGGQVNLAGAAAFGVGYNMDVYHDAFRVIRAPEDGGGGVVFGWDGASNSLVVYGDVTISGTVTATAFNPG